ncbi:SHOCT domain-containing protein [Gulosibacter macacae]|uniref:SHOCT domain-containing protein n=1 Tax=Gulosibacter macacae TaxID=2488791 RepID=A0A3P3VYN4_9MICO|nr:SHOCT domain-containing protein [Gulosibacter macacae]RRJ87905.1 SHOCT domain-containing protein [Gulosibacter macacae]
MQAKGSGSSEFDMLRNHLQSDPAVKREVEFAFASLVGAANPSDRGLRFLFGGGAEWILAAASWSAGVLTAPAGHNSNGFDLADLLAKARGLWSVKASASDKSMTVRLTNFMGDGANADWQDPTVFVAPYFGGAVLVDPKIHAEIHSQVIKKGDALTLAGTIVKRFRDESPANFIPFEVAVNKGTFQGDPFSFIKSVLAPGHFPILSRPFLESTPIAASSRVEEIKKLAELRDAGALSEEQFRKAVDQVVS